jgi:hypothetical protein
VHFNEEIREDVTLARPLVYCRADQLPLEDRAWHEWTPPPLGWVVEMGPYNGTYAGMYPTWERVNRVRVPLWAVAWVMGLPWGVAWMAAGVRWLRRRGARGFPVEVAERAG